MLHGMAWRGNCGWLVAGAGGIRHATSLRRSVPNPHPSPHTHIPPPSLIPRSTNLDTWSIDQLRIMKVGGNTAAADYFNKHGGVEQYPDAKAKYSGRVGEMYKNHLRKLAEEDARR